MNIEGVQSLVGSKLNKIIERASTAQEGPEGDFEDELTLKLSDEELIALAKRIATRYNGYEAKV